MKKTLVITLWLLFGGAVGHAALTAVLTPAVTNAARGTELVFSGTLTNTSSSNALFLNDLQAVVTVGGSNALRFGTNAFFANVPGLLLPGEVYTGVVCEVLLSEAAADEDYTGSITFQGGADIFAAEDLASASFAISSATVDLIASQPVASEFGPAAGRFILSRTGSTNTDLTVSCAIAGNATNGIAFQSISSSITIPAGTDAVAIAIVPIPDNVAQGERLAILTINPSAAYNVGSYVSAGVAIRDKPFDRWRLQKFGAAANEPAAADTADWDGDGVINVLEYALNFEPAVADDHPLLPPRIQGNHLTWSYVPNTNAVDVDIVVEASTDLVQWSSADVEVVSVPNPEPPGRVTIRYRQPTSLAPQAFLRLRATRAGNGP